VARNGVDTWLVVIVYIQLFVHQLKQKQLFCNDTAPASVKVKEQALLKPRVFFRTYANSVFSKAKMRIQRLMVPDGLSFGSVEKLTWKGFGPKIYLQSYRGIQGYSILRSWWGLLDMEDNSD
jgi:hypothetical protein